MRQRLRQRASRREMRTVAGGDLDLATGLDCDPRTGGKREMGALGIDRCWCVLPQSNAQLVCGQTSSGIVAVVDGPLELDPVEPRRAVLEADHGHVALCLLAVAQRRRRRVRGWRHGHAGWSIHNPKNITAHTVSDNHFGDYRRLTYDGAPPAL